MTPIVDALRGLLGGEPVGPEIGTAVAWCIGLLLVAYAVAMAVYRRRVD